MKPFSLEKVCSWTGGDLLCGKQERYVNRISTDTRTLQPGDLFIALRGEQFDGHDYSAQAAEKGAIAMLCDEQFDEATAPETLALIQVSDTLLGLQRLAASYRKELDVKVVGITGSNGKTSTKEMLAAVLGVKYRVQKTKGNLNNHIGVPLTLLSLEETTEIAITEMGMNHPGEIRPLAEIAKPDIAVVTGIGWAHIEAFESRSDIAEEKGELVRALDAEGIAVINGDDEFLKKTELWTEAKIVRSGFDPQNDVVISDVHTDSAGMQFTAVIESEELNVSIPVFGRHMAANAGLALAVAHTLGVPLESSKVGLENLDLPGGRLKLRSRARGWVLDDSYNASPDSIAAGVESLDLLPGNGRKVVLLGAMAELGDHSVQLHQWVGERVAANGVEIMGVMGPNAEHYIAGAEKENKAVMTYLADSHEALAEFYLKHAKPDDLILIKGSRRMEMERLVELLVGQGN